MKTSRDTEPQIIAILRQAEGGPPTTDYKRFNRWSYAGHWDRMAVKFQALNEPEYSYEV